MKWSLSSILCRLVLLIVAGFIGLVIMMFLGNWTFQALRALLTGWVTYPAKIFPRISYNAEMIFCGLAALGLALFFGHRILRWLAEQMSALPHPWKFKNTACLSFLILSMFGTSIAMTGIVHQTAWLAGSEKITVRRPILETQMQEMRGRGLLMDLFERGLEADSEEGNFPTSLLSTKQNPDRNLSLCPYHNDLDEPWLFPGAGKPLGTDDPFPVLVSPKPNLHDHIIVAYSNLVLKGYHIDELPPEIAILFE